MRPYFAIIKDSFRAALASRVLYVLLGLITILLLAVAPLHTREVLDWKIKFRSDVKSPMTLVTQLVERHDTKPEIGRIWELLTDETKQNLQKRYDENQADEGRGRDPGRRMRMMGRLIGELNDIIKDREFYREQDWKDKLFNTETEELIKEGPSSLSDERSRRLNRLLVSAALPTAIQAGAPTALDFYYAIWNIEVLSGSTTRGEFKNNLAIGIPWFFDKFVLSIGLAIAILVTANIIPETFDPGSLNLLLSKPVSRWALYLSKFIGGCSFIALCAVYLFLGTWIWMGLALGIWDQAFLWSIPLYILVFAIYYSVSSLVGLSYRSSIMAIVVTGLFWAFCFGVGSIYGFLDARMQNVKMVSVAPVNDQLVAVSGLGQVMAWDKESNSWEKEASPELKQDEEIGQSIAMWIEELRKEPVRLSPVFDRKSERIYAGSWTPVQPFSNNHQDFFVGSSKSLKFKKIGKFPRDSVAMFNTGDNLLIVTSGGRFMELAHSDIPNSDPTEITETSDESVPSQTTEEDDDSTQTISDVAVSKKKKGKGFPKRINPKGELKRKAKKTIADRAQRVGPDQFVSIRNRGCVDYNARRQEVGVFTYREGGHHLMIFRKVGDKYQRDRSVEIETGSKSRMNGRLAFQGNTAVLVIGNGQVITIDAESMKERKGYLPESGFGIESVLGSPDGRWFGLHYTNKTVWLLDTQNDAGLNKPSLTGQGTISAIGFGEDNHLMVVDRTDRVSKYEIDSLRRLETYSPGGGLLEKAYRWLIKPFYSVCPKPSEFYRVVTHLTSTSNEKARADIDLTLAPKKEDPFSPLWSGVAFMVAMLMLACLIFHFKDF